ncbi:MAG: hypothetical protein AABY93_12455 [Bacteroidota bacterium]
MAALLLWGFHVTVIFFLCYWIWRKQDLGLRSYFWPALVLKLGAGVGLGLLYKYHYSVGDTFGFFEDASKLSELFWQTPGSYLNFLVAGDESDPMWTLLINTQSRSLFFVKIVSFVNLLTGDNYWISSLYFSLFSFLSAFLLFQKMATSFTGSKVAAAIAFLFFPSVVFWSSGIIKESLALAGLFMISRVYITLVTNSKPYWWEWLLMLLSGIVVWNLKYYWFAVFMPIGMTTLVVHLIRLRVSLNLNLAILMWITFFLIFCFAVTLFHPNFYIENFLLVLVDNYNQFMRISPQGNIQYQLKPTWWSVILNSPLALVSGLFRPFMWEVTNLLQLIVAIENLFIFILFVPALIHIRIIGQSTQRLLLFSIAVYILILCLFLALSTPNLGTLARYKVGFLPFLVFILLADNLVLDWIRLQFNRFLQRSKNPKSSKGSNS